MEAPKDGDEVELSLEGVAVMEKLCQSLLCRDKEEGKSGCMLIVDYGDVPPKPDTLRVGISCSFIELCS